MGLYSPGGASAASTKLSLPPRGTSAAILRNISKEQEGLWLEPPASPSSPCPEAPGPGLAVPRLCPWAAPLPLLFLCTVSVACSCTSWARAKGGLSISPRGGCPQCGSDPSQIRRTFGRGMPRNASSQQPGLGIPKLTFYRQFCTFVEKCVTSPNPIHSFLLFCKK